MPTVKTSISSRTYTNVDSVELSDDSQILIDGYLDEAGASVKRPGLSQELDLGLGANNQIDAIYWWEQKGYAIVVSAGSIYKVTRSAGVLSYTDLTGTGTLTSDKRVSIASDGTNVYLANGGRIVYTDGSATTQFIADGDAPTTVTHIGFIDSYLVANEVDTDTWYFSDILDAQSWTASSYATAVGNPDYTTALHIFQRQIYFFGPSTLEIWENDGENPFSRIPAGFYETGCIAPYSVVNTDTSIIWLNHKKHFVELDYNGSLQELPTDFDKLIQGFDIVSDCTADRIEIDGKPFLVFSFPAENRTLAYNYQQETWSEWRNYVGPSKTYNRWKGNCYAFSPSWNLHLVGGKSDSIIYSMSPDHLDDAGDTIRMKRLTGHLDYGTSKTKRCNELRLRLKRGTANLIKGFAAAEFNGVSSRISLANTSGQQSNFEVGVDFYLQEQESLNTLIGPSNFFPNFSWELKLKGKTLVWSENNADSITYPIQLNKWYSARVVVDSTTSYLYVDGTLVGSVATSIPSVATSDIYIGLVFLFFSLGFKGYMKNVYLIDGIDSSRSFNLPLINDTDDVSVNSLTTVSEDITFTEPTEVEPELLLRYNDDNKGWSNEISIPLGRIGDREIYVRIFPRGIYRTRQYELVATDNVPIIYLDSEEDIDVLSR